MMNQQQNPPIGDDVDLNNLAHLIAKEMLDKHLNSDGTA